MSKPPSDVASPYSRCAWNAARGGRPCRRLRWLAAQFYVVPAFPGERLTQKDFHDLPIVLTMGRDALTLLLTISLPVLAW